MTSSEWEKLHDMIYIQGLCIVYDSRIEKQLPHLNLERLMRIVEDRTLLFDDIPNSVWADIEAEYSAEVNNA